MMRRCVCDPSSPTTVRRALVVISSHGDIFDRSSGSWARPNTRRAQIIWVHVVPHFGGVLTMMSPERSSNPSQRALSEMVLR